MPLNKSKPCLTFIIAVRFVLITDYLHKMCKVTSIKYTDIVSNLVYEQLSLTTNLMHLGQL